MIGVPRRRVDRLPQPAELVQRHGKRVVDGVEEEEHELEPGLDREVGRLEEARYAELFSASQRV